MTTFLVTPDRSQGSPTGSQTAEHPKDVLKCFLCYRMVKPASGPRRGPQDYVPRDQECETLTRGEKGKQGLLEECAVSEPSSCMEAGDWT